jgi:threonine dehydrogenase-like Zn-dependent dehydrogenase
MASIRVNACAGSAYDARISRKGSQKVRPSVILGHELCGEVLETVTICNGKVIQSYTGTAVSPIISYLSCKYYNNKRYNLCADLR